MDNETMVNPFTRVLCDVKHLNPGDLIDAGDVYRSTTLSEKDADIGRWFVAGDVIAGTAIGATCNVHFIRLSPQVKENG
jgi:hypothetical protein